MESWAADIQFERQGPVTRVMKGLFVNPVANYCPAGLLRGLLRWTRSEVAESNWVDPGGWRSMVISYHGDPPKGIDKILVKGGTIPMALRNRRKLAARVIARLIDEVDHDVAHVLCLGAGPGHIIMDALQQASHPCETTLVDLNSDAFDYGRQEAAALGLSDRMTYVHGDVNDVVGDLTHRVDVVKMMGICEYLEDEQIVSIARSVAQVMLPGGAIVFNSISDRHGTDRFFRRIFGLEMIHRSPAQLETLFSQAGLGDYQEFEEPLGVYTVVVARLAAGRD